MMRSYFLFPGCRKLLAASHRKRNKKKKKERKRDLCPYAMRCDAMRDTAHRQTDTEREREGEGGRETQHREGGREG